MDFTGKGASFTDLKRAARCRRDTQPPNLEINERHNDINDNTTGNQHSIATQQLQATDQQRTVINRRRNIRQRQHPYRANHTPTTPIIGKEAETMPHNKPKVYIMLSGWSQAPLLKDPPPLLDELLDSNGGRRCREFRDKIRMYNTIFAFTSMGGKIDKSLNNGSAPYAFRISGQNYHLMGSLVPAVGKAPKFLQLYIYDTDHEVENRMSVINNGQDSTSAGLDEDLVKELLEMLDKNNELVKVFRMARDRFKEDELIPIRVKLIGNRSRDTRAFNTPTASEIAALIVGDIEDTIGYRDIIVDHKKDGTQQINETHPSFMSMQYPLLFPYGEDGYVEKTMSRDSSTRPNKKRKYSTMCEHYAFRVQQRRTESSALLRSGRLFLQYLVDAYTCIEAERLRFIRFNQSQLRVELYDGLVDAIARGDTDATQLGKRYILPSSFTGGTRYKVQNYQDAMAICRVYGNPDLFITFTANTKWAEVQSMLSEIPGQKVEDRPDIIVRVFKLKLDALMKDLI
ncbi:uncharacterized protein LOC141648644 [Silene latifolia]|uniref:uncharacterized protein LOC141648644 n=1 Tax=Silene latifolia TaxID=37657 RepID=UPI003D770AB7